MLRSGASFNFYMFHGGTNFGFTAGANHDKCYQPTITSYDDDALLNEWGGYTDKYYAVRKELLSAQSFPKQSFRRNRSARPWETSSSQNTPHLSITLRFSAKSTRA